MREASTITVCLMRPRKVFPQVYSEILIRGCVPKWCFIKFKYTINCFFFASEGYKLAFSLIEQYEQSAAPVINIRLISLQICGVNSFAIVEYKTQSSANGLISEEKPVHGSSMDVKNKGDAKSALYVTPDGSAVNDD